MGWMYNKKSEDDVFVATIVPDADGRLWVCWWDESCRMWDRDTINYFQPPRYQNH